MDIMHSVWHEKNGRRRVMVESYSDLTERIDRPYTIRNLDTNFLSSISRDGLNRKFFMQAPAKSAQAHPDVKVSTQPLADSEDIHHFLTDGEVVVAALLQRHTLRAGRCACGIHIGTNMAYYRVHQARELLAAGMTMINIPEAHLISA